MTTTPCKHCADRVLGCHGVCKDYIEWKAIHKDEREGNRAMMKPTLKQSSFTGTSPKPGVKRKYYRT